MTCHSEASMTMIYDYVLISQDAHGLHCSPNISKVNFCFSFGNFNKPWTQVGGGVGVRKMWKSLVNLFNFVSKSVAPS